MENSQDADFVTFMQGLEDEWAKLEMNLNKARERWIQEVNKEWSNWIRSVENKWSQYSKVPKKTENPTTFRKQDAGNNKWKKWFKMEAKSKNDAQLKKGPEDATPPE
ncbi:hypothetical protein AK88_04305 [Plasmodium fragile]|uniref:Tryptophan/threonine-rich plasmodium antigen C-terminal domain-containing protein n=1 Tax=Plasmodium fragile TaxID=5857 RepID=A0A0D9QGD4_PLAFR|nr:uncharacterized protein AK88_04305 [Plasmodium fragile]KJP86048.1 hypothetical protein AK88_04305 [Plasmodium fragile]